MPEAGKIFVVGNVHKPGAFPVRDAQPRMGPENGRAVRRVDALTPPSWPTSTGARPAGKKEIPVELDKIMQRKSPDVALAGGRPSVYSRQQSRRMAMTVDRPHRQVRRFHGVRGSDLALETHEASIEPPRRRSANTYRVAGCRCAVRHADAEYRTAAAHVPLAHYLWILRRQAGKSRVSWWPPCWRR